MHPENRPIYISSTCKAAASRRPALPRAGSRFRTIILMLLLLLVTTVASAQTNVVTHHYDNMRTGANTNETILTPANVNKLTFGKLFTSTVDGQVYAEPLYIPGITMGAGTPQAGTTHNVVIIATEHDSVYVFDADNNGGANSAPLWQITLLDAAHGASSGATTVPATDLGTADITPEIGITGTPVIDPVSNILYIVGKTKETGVYVQRLHAIDLTTGLEKLGGPVTIAASVPGTGTGSSGGTLNFDPEWENQRPGLLLQNGIVYIGFASHGDNGPWHGWILSYKASSLVHTGTWCASPNNNASGIWMSGAGLAADIPDPVNSPYGRMFVATGNGTFSAVTPYTNGMSYGDSEIRLDLTNGVPSIQDDFTPFNQASLNGSDGDLGSGGVLLLPDQTSGGHTRLLVQAGKGGTIYLTDRDTMGGYNSTANANLQALVGALPGGIWAKPAYWNGTVYYWGSGDHLKSFPLTNGLLATSPSGTSAESIGYEGATPSVSANGTTNGIVWTVEGVGGHMVLFAHNALNVSQLLYTNQQNSGRDAGGIGVKFSVATVINGKVYVGDAGQFEVYGLLNGVQQAATPVIHPASQTFTGSVSVTITDSTPSSSIFYTTDGTTPTTSSTLYTGAFSVTTTETVQAIASSASFLQSPVASATYTLQTQAISPTFNPPPGTYSTSQSVAITTTTPGATIYYSTDGSTPTTASTVYSTPVAVLATLSLKAIAIAPGFNTSPLATGTYSILQSATAVDFSLGFGSSTGVMTFNGTTGLNDTRLQLTNGGLNQAGSAFYNTPVNIQSFTTDFLFQLSNPAADGITFTIQGTSPTVLGQPGGGLGYGASQTGGTGGIPNSVAIKFDLFNNEGEGIDSTGLYTNGAAPTVPALDLTASGLDLHSGDGMSVHVTYDGTTLSMTITDAGAGKTFAASWPVNIPAIVGGGTAYVGFTGGTSAQTSSQKILTWTFNTTATIPVFTPGAGTYLGQQNVTLSDATPGATFYYTTDGSTPTSSSTKYTGPISVTSSRALNALATAAGYLNSPVATAAYTIESQVAAPLISPASGTYVGAQTVTITDSTPGATIYYTTNGGVPTTSSAIYTGPFLVNSSGTTVLALAASSGYFNSNVSGATYTLTLPPPAATPTFNPPGSTITSTQSITLSDSTTGSTIYYTTDGSTPNPGSGTTLQYSAPFTLAASSTVKAVAIATNFGLSSVGTAIYTVQTVPPSINFSGGFTSSTGLTLNGGATVVPNRLRLTDGGATEARSAFFSTPVNVQTFTNDFSFQLTNPSGDGITFTIQADAAPTEVGPAGSSLAYGSPVPGGASGIPLSIAVKFDDYSNNGEGTDSTGLYTNGASPTIPAIDMTSSGVSLLSGDIFNVHMTYDGATLSWIITDATTGKSFSTSTQVNLLSILESPTAYVGFTGSTGGTVSTQEILSWTFSGTAVNGFALPIHYETESLPGTSSGPAYQVVSWAGFTDGSGSILQATAAGDNVVINLNVPATGTYDIRVGVKRTSNRGTMQLSLNGSNIGSPVDEYSNVGDSWNEFDLGNAALAAGTQPFKFTVTGKNASSTGFPISFDYITLMPVGGTLTSAATPTFSPVGGTYTAAQSVTISDTTTGATIYYTTDGSNPTALSTKYTAPVAINSSLTLNAIAVASGFSNSSVGTAAYVINLPQAATPTFSPVAGTYTSAQSVTISDTTAGATIYYTTNGSTPTTSSTKYTAPVAVNSSETLNAIAVATGFSNSNVGAAAYTINVPQAATPTFLPGAGTYSSAQTVTISDTTTGATIYYTTDGSTPTASSTKYTAAVPVNSSETLNAIAIATGFTNSNVGTAAYVIQGTAPSINFATGFASSAGLTLNGGAAIVSNRVRLTDGGVTEARSVFYSTPVNIQTFISDFSFQVTNPAGSGLTFAIIGTSTPARVGPAGSSLGYGALLPGGVTGIPLSAAIKFDLRNDNGEGINSTGLYTNGASPTTPSIDMTASGLSLHSGNILNVHVTYDGTTLTWTITDPTAGKSFSTSAAINLLNTIESPTAYVGFTASTGGSTSTQDIVSWSYTGTPVSGAKLPVRFDTETLPGVSSGPAYAAFNWAGFMNGAGSILYSTKAGDSVTITLNVPAAGTYDVRVGTKNTTTRGTMQLAVNGTIVGPVVDQYSKAGDSWGEFDLGTVSLGTGNQPFTFTVTGKNAASLGYYISFDYITLIPQ